MIRIILFIFILLNCYGGETMPDYKRIIQRTTSSERIKNRQAKLEPNELVIIEDTNELGYYNKNMDFINVSKNNYIIKTVEDLKNSNIKYKIGDIIEIIGYSDINDTASHIRVIELQPKIGGIKLKNNLWANFISLKNLKAKFLGATSTKETNFNEYKNLDINFEGETVTINLEPLDSIPNWKGYGIVKITNYLGQTHICKIENLDIKNVESFRNKLKSKIGSNLKIGFVGDSITDGAYGKTQNGDWIQNPLDPNTNNFNSTNYNHSLNGGYGSWASVLTRLISSLGIYGSVSNYNIASAGKRTMSDWTYRNIDYGFFSNDAYENKVPELVIYSMGFNDAIVETPVLTVQDYYNSLKKNIQKLTMYGSSVLIVLPVRPRKDEVIIATEKFAKDYDIEFIKLYEVIDMANMNLDYNYAEFWKSPTNVIENVHPATEMQKIIGSFCFKNLFDYYIINTDFDTKIDLATDSRILNKPFILLDYSTYDNISKDVFSFGGSNKDGNFKIFVWSNIECLATFKTLENNRQDTYIYTHYNDFASSNTKTISSILYGKTNQPDRRTSVKDHIAKIEKGLNIIQIEMKAGMFAPILEFENRRYSKLDYGKFITTTILPTYSTESTNKSINGITSSIKTLDKNYYKYNFKNIILKENSFIFISEIFGTGLGLKFQNKKIYFSYFDGNNFTDIISTDIVNTINENINNLEILISSKNNAYDLQIKADNIVILQNSIETTSFFNTHSSNLSGKIGTFSKIITPLLCDYIEFSYALNIEN